jgi:hypothetical protein
MEMNMPPRWGFRRLIWVAITMSLLRNSLRSALMTNNIKRKRFSHFFRCTRGKFLPWNSPPRVGAGSSGAKERQFVSFQKPMANGLQARQQMSLLNLGPWVFIESLQKKMYGTLMPT